MEEISCLCQVCQSDRSIHLTDHFSPSLPACPHCAVVIVVVVVAQVERRQIFWSWPGQKTNGSALMVICTLA